MTRQAARVAVHRLSPTSTTIWYTRGATRLPRNAGKNRKCQTGVSVPKSEIYQINDLISNLHVYNLNLFLRIIKMVLKLSKLTQRFQE